MKLVTFRLRIKSYLFNVLWGVIGVFLLLFIGTWAVSSNSPLPPRLESDNGSGVFWIIFIVLIYVLGGFVINLIGFFKYLKHIKSHNRFMRKIITFMVLNIILYVLSFAGTVQVMIMLD